MLGDFPRAITAAGVNAARLGGALRYWPKDGGSSIVVGLSRTECVDLTANGVPFATIYEGPSATWMAGGGSAGVQAGNWLKQQFINAGHTPRCVYLAADSNTLSAAAINACLDGAASILGHDKIGLYAYLPQLQAAHAGGHASFYWLTGHYVAPAAYPWINVYQCQGSQPAQYPTTVNVSGQTGDGDLAFTSDWGQNTGPAPAPSKPQGETMLVIGSAAKFNTQAIADANGLIPLDAETAGNSIGPDGRFPISDALFTALQERGDALAALPAAVTALQVAVAALGTQMTGEQSALVGAIQAAQTGQIDMTSLANQLAGALVPALSAADAQQFLALLAGKLNTAGQ